MEKTFVLPKEPEQYPFNPSGHCGAYTIKAVAHSYGSDYFFDPKDYHINRINRFFGWTLGREIVKTLKYFGVKSEKRYAHGNLQQKINLLKTLLVEEGPVILNIGSCYQVHSRWIAKIIPHWVTVWGYDEYDFYVYDSNVPLEKQNYAIPIGNRKIEHQDLVWYWGYAYWFHIRGIFRRRYLYLPTEKIS